MVGIFRDKIIVIFQVRSRKAVGIGGNMSAPGCSDVCEIVHMRLNALGFKISGDDEDHTDIIEALSHVKFVRDD